jgi:hypothetical protein
MLIFNTFRSRERKNDYDCRKHKTINQNLIGVEIAQDCIYGMGFEHAMQV